MTAARQRHIPFDYTTYGFRDEEHHRYTSPQGLNAQVVRTLAQMKGEPE